MSHLERVLRAYPKAQCVANKCKVFGTTFTIKANNIPLCGNYTTPDLAWIAAASNLKQPFTKG